MPLQPCAWGGQSAAVVQGTVQKPPPLAGNWEQSIEVQSESAVHIDPNAPAAASSGAESPRPPPSPQPLQWSLSGAAEESSLAEPVSAAVPVSAMDASPPFDWHTHSPYTPALSHVAVPDAPPEQVHDCIALGLQVPPPPDVLLLLQPAATNGTRNAAKAS